MVDEAEDTKPFEKVSVVVVALPGNSYPMVLVITPVPELYEIPAPPESDVLEILLLKTVKSPEAKKPLVERLAAWPLV